MLYVPIARLGKGDPFSTLICRSSDNFQHTLLSRETQKKIRCCHAIPHAVQYAYKLEMKNERHRLTRDDTTRKYSYFGTNEHEQAPEFIDVVATALH